MPDVTKRITVAITADEKMAIYHPGKAPNAWIARAVKGGALVHLIQFTIEAPEEPSPVVASVVQSFP